jgi:thioredoxin-related protein
MTGKALKKNRKILIIRILRFFFKGKPHFCTQPFLKILRTGEKIYSKPKTVKSMKMFAAIFLIPLFLFPLPVWLTSLEKAQEKAKTENKNILINFSGSDWCMPCIKMKKELFDAPTFTDFAVKNLILLNADFPRRAKNRLSENLLKQNESLAAKYNPKGIFPLTLLLSPEGKVLKTWEGYAKTTPSDFVSEIKKY